MKWLVLFMLVVPFPSQAEPVSAFFYGISTFVSTGVVAGAGVTGAFALGTNVAAFFSSTLGSILLNVGLAFLTASKPKGPQAPTIEEARVNSRLADAPRWQMAGTVSRGGEVGIFGEHDESGNFWYLAVHGDAEITGTPTYYLDGIEVTLSDGTDGFTAGDVLTDDFCLTDEYEQYEGTGTRVPYFRLYTVTPSSGSDYGTKPSAFTSAFSNLPANFLGVGVCYTVIRCKAAPPEHRGKVYRWRGAIGIGEPSVTIVANFNRMYDPRNGAHDIDDPTTWTAGDGNPAIAWAWFRTSSRGRNRPMTEINWTKVAAEADKCDATVLDRSGNSIPRYRCGVAFPDNKPRHECEAEILMTADAFVVYDSEGKAWPRVGVYEAPTLTFSAARDIMSAETEVVDDGEAAVDGVIVNYISPDHDYTKQPAAPWQNTNYYDGVSEPNYRTLDILGCQNHNQAVRLAKAIGLRSAASKRIGVGTTVKGILAKGERTIDLDYDAQFTGDYEIVTPVEEDPSGMATSFACVPMQTDRYDLGAGEEGVPPAPTPALNISDTIAAATNVVITAAPVETSSGAAVRLEATFDAPSRVDRRYRFRYAPTGTTVYEYFFVDMDDQRAYSAVVEDGVVYDVQYQTTTAGGRASAWSSIVNVTATANPTAPAALASASATGGAGEATVDFTTANDTNQASVAIYRNSVATYGSATLITTVIAGANVTNSATETGLAAGTYYYWATPQNGSGVAGTPSGPFSVTVT
ncbi:hypothetical protein BV394_01925 [Brevirhabdus pacifica]|uniref:Uncharacterized protein n=1 Tax=Brevirhabdus pacifica TaxID=1267768 RepID=A0A1U7DFG0_9RHOB|nr:hypothetical protein [Brevirhabdus pacifica]APX88639.1 hypothetical protein BV394_01925 [Brevirhabdus pacifica]OWU79913.1 hypothetical protein ATO5_02615 [Loktanella sp. 22II-4b]PJJ86861.1 hypothetical protein CLV77_1421 [Brevirhabdus pacifica]